MAAACSMLQSERGSASRRSGIVMNAYSLAQSLKSLVLSYNTWWRWWQLSHTAVPTVSVGRCDS